MLLLSDSLRAGYKLKKANFMGQMESLTNTNPIKENDVMEEFFQNFCYKMLDLIGALFFAFIGYFSPVSHVVHVVIIFFVIDIIYGWRADVKLNNAKFQPSIVWKKTMPRMVLSIVLLLSAFMIDVEAGQEWIDSYKVIGWIICGLLFMSILKNGMIVTRWGTIAFISRWTRKKVKDVTGITIKESDL